MHPDLTTEDIATFWSHADTTGDCWQWTARRNTYGYGRISLHGREYPAHRLAWILAAGPIPAGMHVLHTCDNPACVRNDDEGWYEVNGILHPRRGHLWLGTNLENIADRVAKKRCGTPGRRPLTEAQVRAKIRKTLEEKYGPDFTKDDLIADYHAHRAARRAKLKRP